MIKVHNPHLLTVQTSIFTIDVLGGVDLSTVERMVCTLRVTYKAEPIYRTTIDLYNENQTDKLIRTLCDKWEVKLLDVSKTVYNLTLQLEDYRLEQLKFKGQQQRSAFALSIEDKKQRIKNARKFNTTKSTHYKTQHHWDNRRR